MEISIVLLVIGFVVGIAVLWGITRYEIKKLKFRVETMELWISTLRDAVMKQVGITGTTLKTIDEIVKLIERSNHESTDM